MRRVFFALLCLLFLCGCASSGKYEEGYAAGYDAGYKAALENRAMPEITPAPTARATATPLPTVTPRVTSTPRPTSAPPADDFTVYISSSKMMHKKANCSGMKDPIEMPYSVAKEYYTKKCSKCFK